MVGLYCASKAALETFSMAMRMELRPAAVKVAIVGMGAVESDLDRNRVVDDGTGSCYEVLASRMIARTRAMRDRALPAVEVARVVEQVMLDPDPPFRTYVGEGFGEALAAMVSLSDEAFEAQVYGALMGADV